MFSLSTLLIALAATSARALPLGDSHSMERSCSLSAARLQLPLGQTSLAVPTGPPAYVTMGVGVQNYTCISGVWSPMGAVASLYDISCYVHTPLFDINQSSQLRAIVTSTKPIISHFFAPNGAGPSSPRFNLEPFAYTKMYSTLAKTASLASPQGSCNVPWLQLSSIAGTLATSVYRVDTLKGQPPSSCNHATAPPVLSVDYVAKYWLYA